MASYADPPAASLFTEQFCQRVRALRARRWPTQKQAAEAMGVPVENWRKYETRTPLPHWLIRRFCLVMDITVEDLFAVERPLPRVRSAKQA